MTTTSQQLAKARQKLLDLTLRNRLLNYRPSKLRSITVTGEAPSEVFDALVLKEKPLNFRATKPRREARSDSLAPQVEQESFAAEEWAAAGAEGRSKSQTDRYLDTPLDEDTLSKKLFHVYHEGHTLIEEQGYSVVHIAAGFLEWYESDDSVDLRRAPLLLIPAELERVHAGEFSRVKWTGEDVQANVSLEAKVAEQGVILPLFMAPEEPGQLDTWFAQVKAAVAQRPRWRVTTDVVLDFFSFTKFVMFKDLDPAVWPEEKKPEAHPLLRSLFEPEPLSASEGGFREDDVDRKVSSRGALHVTDADPSQIAVIEDARAGRNLVVEGPPGTGKSQTITNLVAETLAAGKTVLFVSEKMAALDVVKKRLDRAGLAPFCLELHSRKTNKKAVLEELRVSLQSTPPAAQSDALYEEHELLKADLNAYAEGLRAPAGASGHSVFETMEERQQASAWFERGGRTISPLPQIQEAERLTPQDLAAAERALREVGYLLPLVAPVATSVWRRSSVELFLPHDEATLIARLTALRRSVEQLSGALRDLEALAGVAPAERLTKVDRVCRAALVMARASRPIERGLLLNEAWNGPNDEAERLIARVETLDRGLREAAMRFTDETIAYDAMASRVAELRPLASRLFRIFNARYRQLRRELASSFRTKSPATAAMLAQLDGLVALQHERRALREAQYGPALFGGAWRGAESDVAALSQLASWLVSFRRALVSEALSPHAVELASGTVEVVRVEQLSEAALQTAREIVSGLRDVIHVLAFEPATSEDDVAGMPLERLDAVLQTWAANVTSLGRWAQFNAARATLRKTAAAPLEPLLLEGNLTADDLVPLLRLSEAESLLGQAFAEQPALARFAGEIHEKKVARFQELDRKLLVLNRTRLLRLLHDLRPVLRGGVAPSSEHGILLGELNRKRNHLPIRQLLVRAGQLVQRIKPCFLMSPLSVAQYLDAKSIAFDLIVFDEASQVRPEDALGALLRGGQLVVMGDSKQLPPTSFFDHLVDDDEQTADGEEPDTPSVTEVESILHQCKRSYPSKYLTWHYRSQHDSLIAVSNNLFYENRLRAFPSAFHEHEDFGLHFRHLPNTVYDRGKSATNRDEARAVARAAIEHFRTWGEKRSLGVGTFNLKQQQTIQEEIELELRAHPELEPLFQSDRPEHFFVKNLETIQGDERDVIFISVGYGRDSLGRLTMSFGPLTHEGGERRLNVLISRSRLKCVVFSNFTYRDMALEPTSSRGVFALKSFLEFAETRQLVATDLPLEDTDSPFEDAVYEILSALGYIVRKQVGCAGYRIDLAIADPSHPGSFLLAIECDGAKYHCSPVARDRDRLRQQILEGLGWRIHRIWSTDWYRNRHATIERLLAAVEHASGDCVAPPIPPDAEPDADPPQPAPAPPVGVLRAWWEEVAEYQRCGKISQPTYSEFDFPRVAAAVEEVLLVEGPMHFNELVRRLARLYGFGRSSNRIRAAIGRAVKALFSRKRLEGSGDFLRLTGQTVQLRRRTSDPAPKIDLICKEEISLAVLRALDIQITASPEDALVQASRALGFAATHSETQQAIREVLDLLIDRGDVVRVGGLVRAAATTRPST